MPISKIQADERVRSERDALIQPFEAEIDKTVVEYRRRGHETIHVPLNDFGQFDQSLIEEVLQHYRNAGWTANVVLLDGNTKYVQLR